MPDITIMNQFESLPCPFCGEEESRIEELPLSLDEGMVMHFFLNCVGCGTDGPKSVDVDEAFRMWNQRAGVSRGC